MTDLAATTARSSIGSTAGSARSGHPSLPDRVGVCAWDSSRPVQRVTHTDGLAMHDPRSEYVETFWLPLVGPSSLLLLRQLADRLDREPEGFEIELDALGSQLGLGGRSRNKPPIVRTIERCATFGFVHIGHGFLLVQRRLRGLRPRQVARLPRPLQDMHHAWAAGAHGADEGRRDEVRRAQRLAETLLSMGDPGHAVERQLHALAFEPGIAWHAVHLADTARSATRDQAAV